MVIVLVSRRKSQYCMIPLASPYVWRVKVVDMEETWTILSVGEAVNPARDMEGNPRPPRRDHVLILLESAPFSNL
jgi:hypothetical protein